MGRIKDVFLHDSSKDALRRIFIWRISVLQMIHFISKSFFFQFPFEGNEIWIICKATCFKQKANHNNIFDFRSNHQRCSVEKGVLKNFSNFMGSRENTCAGVSF